MSDEAKDVTAEYARQIVAAVHEHNDTEALFLVTDLLKEFGSKLYRQGRESLVADMAKRV